MTSMVFFNGKVNRLFLAFSAVKLGLKFSFPLIWTQILTTIASRSHDVHRSGIETYMMMDLGPRPNCRPSDTVEAVRHGG